MAQPATTGDLMPTLTAGQLTDQLREAIVRRAELRPRSAAHWRAVCDVKKLQRELVTALASDGVPAKPPSSGGLRA